MRWTTFFGAAAGAACVMLTAGAASAQVFVIDTPSANRCSAAANAIGRNDAALPACDMAIAADGLEGRNLAGTYTNRGVLKLRAGRTDAAMSDFDTALAIDSRLGEAWIDRAAGLLQQARYRETVEAVNRGLPLARRGQEMGYFLRAIARENLSDDAGAYRDFSAAAQVAPGWETPRMNVARFDVRPR